MLATGVIQAADDADVGVLQEVTVTARRTVENLQNVPIAVTVVDPSVMANTGVFTPTELAHAVPGFRASSDITSSRDTYYFNVRGQNQTFGTLFPAVIPYFADVPLTTFAEGLFYDIENVQVLKGTQGVRFGRVTDGGAVLINPHKADNDFGGYATVKVGDFGLNAYEGAINLPLLTDKVLFRGAFAITRRSGFTENLLTHTDLDNVHSDSGRITLTLRPWEGVENTTVYNYLHSNTNGTSNVLTAVYPSSNMQLGFLSAFQAQLAAQQAMGPRTVSEGALAYGANGGIYAERFDKIAVNTTTAQLPADITLKNIFGYFTHVERSGVDEDGTPIQFFEQPHRFVPHQTQEQWSEELQLQGNSFDSRLSWLVGTYWDSQKPDGPMESESVVFGAVDRFDVQLADTKSKAAYGNLEYDLASMLPGLKVNGGLRYTRDTVDSLNNSYQTFFGMPTPHGVCQDFTGPFGPEPCVASSDVFNATTWEFGVSYKPADATMVYASVRRGYRPGGFNPTGDQLAQYRTYTPEFTREIEVGVKSDWKMFGMPGRTDLAAYYNKLKGLQKTLIIPVPGGGSTTAVTNAAAGTVEGFELENVLFPIKGLKAELKWAYTDSHYDRGSLTDDELFGASGACNAAAPVNIGFCPFNRFAQTPLNQATAALHYTLPLPPAIGEIAFGGEYFYQSSVALEDNSYLSPTSIESGYGLGDLDASWTHIMKSSLDISVFVTNVSNREYRIGGVSTAYFSSLGFDSGVYAPPRMYGASFSYHFGE
jgi:iron complex outermembrane receptor protein